MAKRKSVIVHGALDVRVDTVRRGVYNFQRTKLQEDFCMLSVIVMEKIAK